jgi:hypothetical protein
MVKILAKSIGVELLNHSNNVSRFAVEIAKQSLLEVDEVLIEHFLYQSLGNHNAVQYMGKSHIITYINPQGNLLNSII